MLCVSCVPASCFLIWLVSCPHFKSSLVNSVPGVCDCVYYHVYLSPVFWVPCRLVYLLFPVFLCVYLDVVIKDYYFEVYPRLRVPRFSLLCAPWHWVPEKKLCEVVKKNGKIKFLKNDILFICYAMSSVQFYLCPNNTSANVILYNSSVNKKLTLCYILNTILCFFSILPTNILPIKPQQNLRATQWASFINLT